MQTPTEVLCAGIVVADHICTPVPHVPAAGELVVADRILLTIGGCAANVAVDLSRMGVGTCVAGRVGGDVYGREIRSMLQGHGLDVSTLEVTPDAETSQTLIVNVRGQDRRFVHSFGANGEFRAGDIPEARVRNCRVLYVGGYLAMPKMLAEELAPVLASARGAGARTLLDLVVPCPGDYRSQLQVLLPHVDVFLPNHDEAKLITGEDDPVRQAELFHSLGAETAIITLGGEGAVLVNNRERLRSGVYPITFVDGSGGGDAFDAGYIFGLLNNQDAEGCLRYASALGASCVRAVGTTTGVFTRDECEGFMKKHALRIEQI